MGTVAISRLRYGREDYVVVSYPLARPSSFAELTRAELEVVEGILAGHRTAILARRRGVSERTVTNQLARAYRKLGISSRRELVVAISQCSAAVRRE